MQPQWINSALPGVWRTPEQRGASSSSSTQRTAQERATILGGPQRQTPLLLRSSSGGVRRRGAAANPGWVACAWAWALLAALLLPGAWSVLSEEEEELIVELHNHYRGMVSPSASAMLPLKWDPSLKVIAEGYAAKCVWNHNPDLEETGENLFANTGPLDLREALEKWFFENLDFDYDNNTCPEDKMCGHYTQMVWADTHRVGCAWHLCNTMDGLDFEKANFLVCNYYPAGNYDDQKPYVEGEWCSSCPENMQKCENNLCVIDTPEEEEEEDEDEDMDAVTDEGAVTPPPATDPPAAPEPSSESEPSPDDHTPPPRPPALGTQPPPTSPYLPPPGAEEEGEDEEAGNELDQIADHKTGERPGEGERKRERETNREEMTISVSAADGLIPRVFQLVLVFSLTAVGLVVRE